MPSTTCSNAPSRQAGGSLACPQAINKPVKAVSHRNRRGRLVTNVKRSSTFCCNHPALKRAPPNGSRLSCGRLARGRDCRSTLVGAGERTTLRFPLKRSEEHTSELQSLAYLVCRLLLEKKKIKSEYQQYK